MDENKLKITYSDGTSVYPAGNHFSSENDIKCEIYNKDGVFMYDSSLSFNEIFDSNIVEVSVFN